VTFYAALSTQEDLKVSEQFVELNRILLQSARLKFQQQLVPNSEVKAAEAALAAVEADLAMARINVSRALSDFATALGVDPSPDAVEGIELVEKSDMPPPPDPLEGLLKRVATSHPLVLAQEATVREVEASYKVIVSERYPKLEFSTRLGGADTSSQTSAQNGGSQDTETKVWSLRALLSLNWRIWDFGALSLRLKKQSEEIQAEKFALAEVRSTVSKGVVTAYRNVNSSRARLNPAEKAVELAEQLVKGARARYRQDLIPRAELLRAEANLAAARKTLIQTEYAVRIDQAMLRIALGIEGP
jgi:outer membrane protein TolC